MVTINLPLADGRVESYALRNSPLNVPKAAAARPQRIAYAAAHVVADPLADNSPVGDAAIDWERTIAFRDYLWDLGLGVAEAMDTAQRGMGLDWRAARELIRRSLDAARTRPGALIGCGVGTDHLPPGPNVRVDDVIAAYEEQIEAIEAMGGRVILMASRALAAAARGADDYARVYGRILAQVKEPVIIHWLGEMFDPALAGYWGSRDHSIAMQTALAIISDHSDKVDGIKMSLLSKEKEIGMRRRLAQGVRMYTGDDFNYPELIAGDDAGYSHALLGIFDAIAPAAAASLARLAAGDRQGYDAILAPTVPLSRHIFKAPTQFYKTGIVFLAYLNGLQDHFIMIGGQQGARSVIHLAELFRLADAARMLNDPDRAAHRMRAVLATAGVH
ncbi:MAG: dihydrodipicolinate synthase family protein [Proteobacteria bacterium]|nr:dihydrodipicolinate synthase family protein [Pseudomonadota bacterium]